eukprot:m.88584 g.88584  ORF g.88584 m.88584 type:complete len:134 (+) comp14947_c0_seq3:492-893(+)
MADPMEGIAAELAALAIEDERLRRRRERLERELREEEAIRDVLEHFGDRDELDILREMVENLLGEDSDDLSRTACRDLLRDVFINIFDYVQGDYDQICDTKRELRARCRRIGFFPKERAKAEGLRALLKVFFF